LARTISTWNRHFSCSLPSCCGTSMARDQGGGDFIRGRCSQPPPALARILLPPPPSSPSLVQITWEIDFVLTIRRRSGLSAARADFVDLQALTRARRPPPPQRGYYTDFLWFVFLPIQMVQIPLDFSFRSWLHTMQIWCSSFCFPCRSSMSVNAVCRWSRILFCFSLRVCCASKILRTPGRS
jgi:hypothetical protein